MAVSRIAQHCDSSGLRFPFLLRCFMGVDVGAGLPKVLDYGRTRIRVM